MKNIVLIGTLFVVVVSSVSCAKDDRGSKACLLSDSELNQNPIGSARMLEDGTVVLTLRAETESAIGHAQYTYHPNDPNYDYIIEHVGELKPGEETIVLPWPEE